MQRGSNQHTSNQHTEPKHESTPQMFPTKWASQIKVVLHQTKPTLIFAEKPWPHPILNSPQAWNPSAWNPKSALSRATDGDDVEPRRSTKVRSGHLRINAMRLRGEVGGRHSAAENMRILWSKKVPFSPKGQSKKRENKESHEGLAK